MTHFEGFEGFEGLPYPFEGFEGLRYPTLLKAWLRFTVLTVPSFIHWSRTLHFLYYYYSRKKTQSMFKQDWMPQRTICA